VDVLERIGEAARGAVSFVRRGHREVRLILGGHSPTFEDGGDPGINSMACLACSGKEMFPGVHGAGQRRVVWASREPSRDLANHGSHKIRNLQNFQCGGATNDQSSAAPEELAVNYLVISQSRSGRFK
jgi:hypothetical protein